MKRKYIIWTTIGILSVVFFPAHLFGRLDFVKAIQGYHLKSDYNFHSPLNQLFPGIRIVVANYTHTNGNMTLTTSKYYPQNKIYIFNRYDEVTIYLNTNTITPPADNITNTTTIKGKILSIDEKHIGILDGMLNKELIKYDIEIDEKDRNILNNKHSFTNAYESDGDGSMVLTDVNGFAPILVDKNAIIETNHAKYLCVFPSSIRQYKLFFNGYIDLVKPRFKNVVVGKRIYMLNNLDERKFIEIEDGISNINEYTYPNSKAVSQISEKPNFNCAK